MVYLFSGFSGVAFAITPSSDGKFDGSYNDLSSTIEETSEILLNKNQEDSSKKWIVNMELIAMLC